MTSTSAHFQYLLALYEDHLLLAKISARNLDRATTTLRNKPGPHGELLIEWMTGSAQEILGTFPQEVSEEDFAEIDALHKRNPTQQLLRERLAAS